jgi:hypothetical protein
LRIIKNSAVLPDWQGLRTSFMKASFMATSVSAPPSAPETAPIAVVLMTDLA